MAMALKMLNFLLLHQKGPVIHTQKTIQKMNTFMKWNIFFKSSYVCDWNHIGITNCTFEGDFVIYILHVKIYMRVERGREWVGIYIVQHFETPKKCTMSWLSYLPKHYAKDDYIRKIKHSSSSLMCKIGIALKLQIVRLKIIL